MLARASLFLGLFSLLVVPVVRCRSSATVLPRLTAAEKALWGRIRSFTVAVRQAGPKETVSQLLTTPSSVEIRLTRAAITERVPWNVKSARLAQAYGRSVERALGVSGRNLHARYFPVTKLGWVDGAADFPAADNAAWMLKSGLDTLIEIRQNFLELDYPTRVPDLGAANALYWVGVLDLWWVDLAGQFRLRNGFTVRLRSLPTGTILLEKRIQAAPEPTGVFWLQALDDQVLQDTLQKSAFRSLREVLQ